jgi:hypothetical protein
MKRLAFAAFAILALAACGSSNKSGGSTAPTDMFTGTWTGDLDGLSSAPVTVTSSQTGSTTSGSASVTYNGTTYTGTFTGTSTPPTITLNFTLGDTTGTYAGNYITADSIAGTFTVTSPVNETASLSLAKQ